MSIKSTPCFHANGIRCTLSADYIFSFKLNEILWILILKLKSRRLWCGRIIFIFPNFMLLAMAYERTNEWAVAFTAHTRTRTVSTQSFIRLTHTHGTITQKNERRAVEIDWIKWIKKGKKDGKKTQNCLPCRLRDKNARTLSCARLVRLSAPEYERSKQKRFVELVCASVWQCKEAIDWSVKWRTK